MSMWKNSSRTRGINQVGLAVALLTGSVAVSVSTPAIADVDASGQRCFSVAGSPGDAALVNLTPVLAQAPGFGLLISSDVRDDVPTGSNVNFRPGSVDPNVAAAQIGLDGEICYQNSEHGTVELVADHLGNIADSAYTPAAPNGAPVRRVDTRENLGGSRVAAWGQLCFAVPGSPGDAAILNVTPVEAATPGFGLVVSSAVKDDVPNGSNVNFAPGTVDPNVTIAPIGSDGEVCYQNSEHGSVHIVIDHLGNISASSYRSASPSLGPERRVDTRINLGGGRVPADGQLCFAVYGEPGEAAFVNLTPVNAASPGYGILISSDVKDDVPNGSNVNFGPGTVDPNVAIAQIGSDGEVCYQNSVHGAVDIVADHLGTVTGGKFTPALPSGALDRRVDTRYDINNPREECEGSTSPTYDHDLAEVMLGISSLAYDIDEGAPLRRRLDTYDDAPLAEELMTCWILVDAMHAVSNKFGEVADTELIIAKNLQTNDIAVAFRGTEFLSWDIINDLSVGRDPWTLPNGLTIDNAVHDGFNDGYKVVRNRLLAALRAQHRSFVPDARVYFTGHSLGGALATLAVLDLVDDMEDLGYDNDEVVTYTFGAPRSMSRTMAGHHASLAPKTYAVASPMDPVPQVPTAIGDNHYSHVKNMIMLNGAKFAHNVRLDQGDGRNHRGCLASFPISATTLATNFALIHARTEYDRRLTLPTIGAPSVHIEISDVINVTGPYNAGGHNRLHWDTPREGPCDQVGLFRSTGTLPDAGADPIVDRNVIADFNDQHTTLVGKGDNYWVGYINIFGELSSKERYVPTTPAVWLSRKDRSFPQKDDLQFNWAVSDPGGNDLIVLFDKDPCKAGPNGYYKSLVGRVEAEAGSNSPEATLINIGDNANDWWVAYIMIEDDGRARILSKAQGFSKTSTRC